MMCSTRNVESAENTWLDADKVRGIVQTVDTEWDRKVVRVLLAANRSRREMVTLALILIIFPRTLQRSVSLDLVFLNLEG